MVSARELHFDSGMRSSALFRNRKDAGQSLADRLAAYAHRRDVVVLGLARGGVPVGFAVAQALAAPFEIFVVRKIGVPTEPELAMGAIASGGYLYLNHPLITELGVTPDAIDKVVQHEQTELARRERAFRNEPLGNSVRGKVAILVDDGLATGASMLAAVQAVRALGPRSLVVAVPVIAPSAIPIMEGEADRLVYVAAPRPFFSVGQWYEDFVQVTDDEVLALRQNPRESPVGRDF